MEKKLTPQQALREYYLHRQKELRILRRELDAMRNSWWIGRDLRTRQLITHTTFLRDLTRFIIAHQDLSQPTPAELATLKHDLRIFESIHTEAIERLLKD